METDKGPAEVLLMTRPPMAKGVPSAPVKCGHGDEDVLWFGMYG